MIAVEEAAFVSDEIYRAFHHKGQPGAIFTREMAVNAPKGHVKQFFPRDEQGIS